MKPEFKEPVEVKVTRLKAVGYGIIVTIKGHEWSRGTVKRRQDVGPWIADDLRIINKCGVDSPMADASRHRWYRKQTRNQQLA